MTEQASNGVHPAVVHDLNGANGALSEPIHPAFDSIPDSIEAFARGDFVVVLDSPSRENEGDLIIAAQHLTTAKSSFLIRHTSGYICAPLSTTLADKLKLPLMVQDTQDPHRTAYTVSIDADVPETSTGISAHDRALTCRLLADPGAKSSWFRRPGHILPLRAREGGVRQRRGHTEAAVELCRLAGLAQVGVIGELITDGAEVEGKAERVGGGMMRRDDCLAFARMFGLKICTIEDLVQWIEEKEGTLDGIVGGDY